MKARRVRIRRWTSSDLDDLYKLCSAPEVFYYGGGTTSFTDITQAKDLLNTWTEKPSAFAVVLKESDEVIGNIGYELVDHDSTFNAGHQLEFGFSIHPDYWNKGYATEALMMMLDVLSNEAQTYCVWVSHYDYNPSSKRVIEKCGFEYSFSKMKRLKAVEDRSVELLFYQLILS